MLEMYRMSKNLYKFTNIFDNNVQKFGENVQKNGKNVQNLVKMYKLCYICDKVLFSKKCQKKIIEVYYYY